MLTFGELKVGEHFMCYPKTGPRGKPKSKFTKMSVSTECDNAVEHDFGFRVSFPVDMLVASLGIPLEGTLHEAAEAETESVPLTFGELERGKKFVIFPVPGDDSGHGGFRGVHYIFLKIYAEDKEENAVRISNGASHCFPDRTEILLVG